MFVAIIIPDPVKAEMIAVQGELQPLALGNVNWANADQLHLTLSFLAGC